MIWRRKDRERAARQDDAVRRLLDAAADDSPPTEPPPFFAARVRVAAEARESAGGAPRLDLASAAARALPVFAAVAIAAGAWASYETASVAEVRERAISRMLVENNGGDLVLAALLFDTAGPAEEEP